MPTYTSPFTGTVVEQTDVTYQYITLSASHQLYWPVTTPQGEYSLSRIMDVQPTAAGTWEAVLTPRYVLPTKDPQTGEYTKYEVLEYADVVRLPAK